MTNKNLSQLQERLQYEFKDISHLETALTHRSKLNESPVDVSNERSEFLGDAVLELVITEYLYHEKPNEPEGILTAARSAIVRTESLAKIATSLDLADFLKMSRGEENSGGRTNVSLLANTTEAVIGSIYLDGGIEPAKSFISAHIIPFAKKILEDNNLKDSKSLLQEKVQNLGYDSPVYTTLKAIGPDHNKTFTVSVQIDKHKLATGKGKNKQTAQQDAAKQALQNIGTLAQKA